VRQKFSVPDEVILADADGAAVILGFDAEYARRAYHDMVDVPGREPDTIEYVESRWKAGQHPSYAPLTYSPP